MRSISAFYIIKSRAIHARKKHYFHHSQGLYHIYFFSRSSRVFEPHPIFRFSSSLYVFRHCGIPWPIVVSCHLDIVAYCGGILP